MFRPTRTHKCYSLTLLSLLVSLVNVWFAEEVSAETVDEIQIRADYMKFDLETGESLYRGNVSIVQGTIKLTGEEVIIRREQKGANEISDIVVSGNPARYLQDENSNNIVRAVSQHMKYSSRENRLVMTDNARLEQSDQTVESQRIIYDTANKAIIAGKNRNQKDTGNRVNITLTPKKNNE